MNIPKDLKYTKTHEWLRQESRKIIVGITDYAQHEISDIVFVELPKVGVEGKQAKAIGVVESVKAAFDIYSPISGTVKAINTALETDPALVNRDPYGAGWFFEISATNPGEISNLLSASEYEEFLNSHDLHKH